MFSNALATALEITLSIVFVVAVILAVLKTIFSFVLGPPPREVPGQGPDCQLP